LPLYLLTLIRFLIQCFEAFSALTRLLGGGKGMRPVKIWVAGCWHGYVSG